MLGGVFEVSWFALRFGLVCGIVGEADEAGFGEHAGVVSWGLLFYGGSGVADYYGGAGAGRGLGDCKIQMGCEFEATGEEGDVLRGGTGAHCVTYRCDLSVVGVTRQMERSTTDFQRNMLMILLSILYECSLLRSECGESDITRIGPITIRNAWTLARGSKARPIELNGSFPESSHNKIIAHLGSLFVRVWRGVDVRVGTRSDQSRPFAWMNVRLQKHHI